MSSLVDTIQNRLRKAPEAIVLKDGNRQFSGQELRTKARGLEEMLSEHGVKAGNVVGLCLPSSPEFVAAVIACLNSGATYVPLGLQQPADRLQHLLETAGVDLLLTTNGSGEAPTNIPKLEVHWDKLKANDALPTVVAAEDSIAYILFTSGSTGVPKGVQITHQALNNHMGWMTREFPLQQSDIILQKTPTTFDASVWEIFAPIFDNGILLCGEGLHQRPKELIDTINENQVTVLQAVPTLYWALIQEGLTSCSSLCRVFSGGELLPAALAEQLLTIPNVEFINLYGPTETTIDAVFWRCTSEMDSVPIGLAVDNVLLSVLDNDGQKVPADEEGELHIGGVQVSPGYINNADQTAASFYFDEHSQTQWYRTGDIVRVGKAGELYFVGRSDRQIKLRGNRIELEEIEAAALQITGVGSAAADVYSVDGEERLILFISGDLEFNSTEVRNQLSAKLQPYMLPHAIHFAQEIPLLPNGKLDRKRLSALLHQDTASTQNSELTTDTQRFIASEWATLLGNKNIGAESNFIELGGDSLLMMQFIASVQRAKNVRLGPELVMLKELSEIAAHLEQSSSQPPEKRRTLARYWRSRRRE